jgi:hypothetical protein
VSREQFARRPHDLGLFLVGVLTHDSHHEIPVIICTAPGCATPHAPLSRILRNKRFCCQADRVTAATVFGEAGVPIGSGASSLKCATASTS